MDNSKNLYKEDSIESLSPLAFTRLRPQVYCGDTTYATQLLVEILSNSVDEARLGHGNLIEISVNNDNAIRVRDYGQGFLVNSIREDGKTVLEAAFSVLNTSGKYREDGAYEGTSLGSFGIGSKLATFLSHWLDVYSYRDKKMEHIHFVEGVFDSRDIATTDLPSGTCVEWLPSEEFFTHVEIDLNYFKKLCEDIVALTPGLTIALDYKGQKETFFSTERTFPLAGKTAGPAQRDPRFLMYLLPEKFAALSAAWPFWRRASCRRSQQPQHRRWSAPRRWGRRCSRAG